jgi:hypothetical protein
MDLSSFILDLLAIKQVYKCRSIRVMYTGQDIEAHFFLHTVVARRLFYVGFV